MADEGKVYDDLYLTATEKALVHAHREGANIDVHFHHNATVDEAVAAINKFGDVDKIYDQRTAIGFIMFDGSENLFVAAYIDK